jgi:cation:H+ antiporter
MDFITFVLAMAMLVYGAECIIRESERIALHFHIPHFIIGASLVALGTSLPEMASSVTASLKDQNEIAVSNVIGSVIFNICLVLGLIFVIAKPIKPKRNIFEKDSAWALFPVMVFVLMVMDNELSRVDGVLFLILMGGYVLFLIQDAQVLTEDIDDSLSQENFVWLKTLLWLLFGFVLVTWGADWAVDSASRIAYAFGVSEWIVGLFLLAFGTSLPELVVSLSAARKNNAELIIGNIIGSNVANFTVVLGMASLINPISLVAKHYFFDISVAVVASVLLVFLAANRLYNKSAGIALLVIFILVIQNGVLNTFG